MAHNNYDKFYTWDGGTLVLDPGVFAYDEPTLELCNSAPVHASALDRVLDPYNQLYCAKPMRFMSAKHAPIPQGVASRCDTIVAGKSYCCPPYVMPNRWRVDSLPLGDIDETIDVMSDEAGPYIGMIEDQIEQGTQEVQQIVTQVVEQPAVQQARDSLSETIRANPILSVGIALMGGIILARMMDR